MHSNGGLPPQQAGPPRYGGPQYMAPPQLRPMAPCPPPGPPQSAFSSVSPSPPLPQPSGPGSFIGGSPPGAGGVVYQGLTQLFRYAQTGASSLRSVVSSDLTADDDGLFLDTELDPVDYEEFWNLSRPADDDAARRRAARFGADPPRDYLTGEQQLFNILRTIMQLPDGSGAVTGDFMMTTYQLVFQPDLAWKPPPDDAAVGVSNDGKPDCGAGCGAGCSIGRDAGGGIQNLLSGQRSPDYPGEHPAVAAPAAVAPMPLSYFRIPNACVDRFEIGERRLSTQASGGGGPGFGSSSVASGVGGIGGGGGGGFPVATATVLKVVTKDNRVWRLTLPKDVHPGKVEDVMHKNIYPPEAGQGGRRRPPPLLRQQPQPPSQLEQQLPPPRQQQQQMPPPRQPLRQERQAQPLLGDPGEPLWAIATPLPPPPPPPPPPPQQQQRYQPEPVGARLFCFEHRVRDRFPEKPSDVAELASPDRQRDGR
ncbi:unnamed protein product, partial [Phaeothamnion confervicola]